MSVRLFTDDIVFLQRFLKSAGFHSGDVSGNWNPETDDALSTSRVKQS